MEPNFQRVYLLVPSYQCHQLQWYSSALFFDLGLFQDCAVGLLFALLLVLGGNNGLLQGMVSMGKL